MRRVILWGACNSISPVPQPHLVLGFQHTWNLASKLLERLTLGLGNEKRGEDTEEHEERENLQNMVEPWVGIVCSGTSGFKRSNEDLGNDGTDFASSG